MDGKGNCFAACLAMVTAIHLRKIPNFCAQEKGWWSDCQQWLLARGWAGIMVTRRAAAEEQVCLHAAQNNIPIILGGLAAGGITRHAVVQFDGKILDPSPSQAGLRDWDTLWILVPTSTWRVDTHLRVHEKNLA